MSQKLHSNVHIQLLDVLRGIAASLVVFHHVLRTVVGFDANTLFNEGVPVWMNHLFLGDLAVTLFFVLSGTSLAISAFSKANPINTRKFFIKRFFRIYPLYVLIILLYFAFRPVYAGYLNAGFATTGVWLTDQFTAPATPVVWLTHLTMTFNLIGIPTNFNNALWSMPIEMQFYLLFPVMILLLQAGRRRGLVLMLVFLGALYSIERVSGINIEFIERAWEFGGGVLIGVFWKTIVGFASRRWIRIILGISAVLLFEISRWQMQLRLFPNNTFEVIFCFVVIALALGFSSWQARTPLARFFVNVGVWSYSLYLIHNLLIGAITPLLHQLGLPPLIYFLIALPLIYSLALVTSRFLYTRFEYPFIRVGARYATKAVQPMRPVHQ